MAKKAQNKKGDDKKIQALRVEHEKRREKLAQDGKKAQAKKKRKSAQRRPTVEVLCAFCNGTGKDPFGVMSKLATCQVCGGTGRVKLHPPTALCAFCRDTGVYDNARLTCTTCDGVGTVEIPVNAVPCPDCGGTGRSADGSNQAESALSCTRCGGKGVVAPPRVPANIGAKPVAELRDLCAKFGLEESGKKAELIDRLRSAKAA